MNIQSKTILSLCCFGAFSGLAGAADFDDYGRVVSVAPQVEQINRPGQECRTSYVPVEQRQQRGVGGSIVGGVAGGLLGNQVGGGNGRVAATALGAITGAIVGDRVENNNNNGTVVTEQPVRECRTVDHWETRNNGYAVTYEYRGHNYTSIMPYDPGERIRLHISVTPRP
jgi:uncharacterized protein YcfJ